MSDNRPLWLERFQRRPNEVGSPPDFSPLHRTRLNASVLEHIAENCHIESLGIIGVGFDDFYVEQSLFVPVLYTTLAQANRALPDCVLVDSDSRIKSPFIGSTIYGVLDTPRDEDDWEWLCDLFGESDRIVSGPEKGLHFNSNFDSSLLRDEKVRAVPTPRSSMPQYNRRVRVRHTSSSDSRWVEPVSLDYVDCSYVIEHLSLRDRLHTVYNISTALAPEGFATFFDSSMAHYTDFIEPGYLTDMKLYDVTREMQVPDPRIRVFQKY